MSRLKKLLLFFILFNVSTVFAETIKTDVLVIGGSASGVSTAIQCARSKVKTLLVEPGPWLGGSMTAGAMCILDGNRDLPSGIWGEFCGHIREFYRHTAGFDTTANAPVKFEPAVGAAILKKMTDTVKNLTVKLNTPFETIVKDGTGWEVTIKVNGKTETIKTRVLVDATELADAAAKIGVPMVSGFESKAETGESIAPEKAIPVIENITWCFILKDFGKDADKTISKPEGYNASAYACLKDKDIQRMLNGGRLMNEKYLIKWIECGNTYGASVNDFKPANREKYYKNIRNQVLGLVYYLQTEKGFKNLGLDDEFGTADHLPFIPYIRENTRIKGLVNLTLSDIYSPYERPTKLYRTSIAVADATPGQHYTEPEAPKVTYGPFPGYFIPMGAIVVKGYDNLIVTEKGMSVSHLVNASSMYPSVQMVVGQGAGCVAAYCAFFKTSTRNFNAKAVRTIQGELLDFKGYLLPIVDVAHGDHDFRAIQQVCATGLLKVRYVNKVKIAPMHFEPDSVVKTAEIKPVFDAMYTRGFLWFRKEKPADVFTVGNMVSLISEMTLSDPKPLELNLEKQWKTTFQFEKAFDLKRPVTRREFAVLANKYLNPFARWVDYTGKFIN